MIINDIVSLNMAVAAALASLKDARRRGGPPLYHMVDFKRLRQRGRRRRKSAGFS